MLITSRGIGIYSRGLNQATVVALALAVFALATQPAKSLIVMNLDPTANYQAPTTATLPGYSDVDPGWANSTKDGVYLGNGWMITAAHTGLYGAQVINSESFGTVAGSRIRIKNPTFLTNDGFSELSDVALWRIDSLEQFSGTPEQRALAQGLEMQPIAISDSTPSINKEVVFIGNGFGRAAGDSLLHWHGSSLEALQGAPETCVGCIHDAAAASGQEYHAIGYDREPTSTLTWGTNKIESSSSVASRFSDFKRVGSYYVLEANDDTIAQAVDFDEYNFTTNGSGTPTGGGGNEVQGAAGDSGSGVFVWDGTRWELTGVMHSVGCYHDANCQYAVAIRQDTDSDTTWEQSYGDLTVFSDLSAYRGQIEAYMAPPEGFEFAGTGQDTRFFHLVGREFGYDATGSLVLLNEGLWGDVNLDGVVSGDGTGDWETDDVTAFIEGWGWQQAAGDIFSWKRGDLNQDGTTDLTDFLLLRSGINGVSGSQLNLSQLLTGGGTTIPEPSALLLAAFALGGGLMACRRRAR